MFFLNPANHIRFFSVILELDIDPEYIHWTLTLFQLEKFQLKFSQYVCYIIWESHCTKIIAARFLKLTVSNIHIDESVWHPDTEPRFFRLRFVKSLTPAEKLIFLDNVVTLNSKKNYLTQAPTMVDGLQFHSSTR